MDKEDNVKRRNVSLFKNKYINLIVRPNSVEEVIDFVKILKRMELKSKLHIISTGRNWGLGSSESSDQDVIILDLINLNKIRDINYNDSWMIIEPGVYQRTVYEELKNSNKYINVTASSGYTSIIGNILERGVGLRHQRTEDLLGLEVITPEGELLKIGWWPEDNKKIAFNSLGHGPSLLHLYTQSNLGIITAAVFKLLPKPEQQNVLKINFKENYIIEIIDLFKNWYEQELVSGVLKIYDKNSTESYGGKKGELLALVCVSGNKLKVEAISHILVQELINKNISTQVKQSLDENLKVDNDLENDIVLKVVEHTYAGDPSWNEYMLKAATGYDADLVDKKGGGWLFFLAFIPFNGVDINTAYTTLENISQETGVKIGTTVNALSSNVIDLVVSIKFETDSENIEVAHNVLDIIYKRFIDLGFYPYRLDRLCCTNLSVKGFSAI
ncbi:FAD-binding oxidoreductase [Acinetobacter gerneri]|uniref:FAD-binding oxidoreductase n=1 Tax=Acinetobacter gerneri TaxID=202952 RepID=UPI0029361D91|nr:FAD-binding oxidoreductase [Acinetobacter gerneri]MDV2440617.1 FAD-binding oxidoreductase [Acinetobacter gerneri]